MHTLVKAAFVPFRRTLLTALPLLGLLALAGTAEAQQPQPFGPQPQPGAGPGAAPSPFGPQPGAPGGFNPQPQPGQPQPGGFGPAPGGGFGAPPGGPAAPGGAQPGGDPSFGASFSGDVSTAAPPPAATSTDLSEEERAMTLMEQPNLSGSTGLLHTSYAGSGAQGTFRTSFLVDWFSTSNFLCKSDATNSGGTPISCGRTNTADKASHVGAFFALNATPLSWLEGYATIRTYANSNDQGRPQLLQVLGDTTFGAKAFTPAKLGKIFTFGGEAQLLLLNGTGDVGVAGGGTSAVFRGLATADFRKPEGQGGLPLRANVNLAYKLDNSGKLVEDVEIKRGAALGLVNDPTSDPGPARSPISRIERYGLGINKVDFFQMYFGVELPFKKVQPYLEWTLDIPVNRQGYICHTSRASKGDECLGLDNFNAAEPKTQGGPGFKAVPSRLSLGARTNPFNGRFRGLSAHLAFDIGTSGTSHFVEEVAPQAPWTMFIGLAYAFDTKEKEIPPPPPPPVAPPPQIIQIPQSYARGLVHEQGKQDAVPDAIVSIEGGGQPPFATGPDGRFLTRHLEPGQYKFNIKAPGYKPGVCTATISTPASPMGAQPGMGPGMAPGMAPGAQPGMQPSPFGGPAQPGMPGGPGAPGMMQPPMQPQPAAPSGPTYVDVDCPLEALPKLGNIVGQVKDGEGGAPVGGAIVRLSDASGKALTATADGSGNFTFKDLGPGAVTLKTEASGYMHHVDTVEVRVSDDNRTNITINKRPKLQLVKVQGNEIKVSKQIHFETDSAKILGDSNSLMEEIADVLVRTPTIKKVEIQGHTDNTGTREHNLQLSDARANAVKNWLVGAGIDGTRLVPKGYGQDRPLAPNVTAANRTKNRRVQFIILEGK